MTAAVLVALAIVISIGPPSRTSRRRLADSTDDSTAGGAEPRVPIRATRRRLPTWIRPALALAVAVTLAALVGPMLAIALGVGAAGSARARRVAGQRRRQRRLDAALPDAIEMLVLVVQAGLTPHQAVALLSDRAPLPVRPALHEVRRRVARGEPLSDALDALPEHLGAHAATVADTLAMAERYGTPMAQAVEQLAFDVREQRRRRAEAEARTLPIRMSFPLVACTLPSFVLVAIVPAVMAAMTSLSDRGF